MIHGSVNGEMKYNTMRLETNNMHFMLFTNVAITVCPPHFTQLQGTVVS